MNAGSPTIISCWRRERDTPISAATKWEGVAPGLKKVDDATGIRRRILTVFAPPGDGCSSTRRPVRIYRRFKTQETFALR
jgi:hypothetical protein